MKRALAVYLLTISAPTLAVAQDLSYSGALTLGVGFHSVSDIDQDLRTTSLDGRLDFDFGNGFSFGVDAGYLDLDIDEVPVDFNAQFIGLDVAYRFANGMSLGAYTEQLTASADLLPIDISLKSSGITAGYDASGLQLGAFIGQSDTSPELPGTDLQDLGLTAKYAPMEGLKLGAAFLRTTVDTAGPEVDLDFLGLAATYVINDSFTVFGGVSKTSLDLLDADATTMGLGAGYLLPMGGVTSTLSLELARTDLSAGGIGGGDLDTVRLGLTLPLGGKGSEAPLNSVADSVFNPRHSAINAGLTSAF